MQAQKGASELVTRSTGQTLKSPKIDLCDISFYFATDVIQTSVYYITNTVLSFL